MKLSDKFLQRILKYMEIGFIRGSAHSSGDLMVFSYTDQCVYDQVWDDVTTTCRGLIMDMDGNVVARPFPKFFNVGECDDTQIHTLPWSEGHATYSKLDGCFGILYRHNGKHHIATRGSFDSEGAKWATRHLHENYNLSDLPDNVTLLFEILSDVSKIIVRYPKEKHGLHLLGAYDRNTGTEYDYDFLETIANKYKFSLVESHNFTLENIKETLSEMKATEGEGFVIRFNNGYRVKMKAEDYCKVAKMLKNLTPLSLWEKMQKGKISEEFRKQCPEEFWAEFDAIADTLSAQWHQVYNKAKTAVLQYRKGIVAVKGSKAAQKAFAKKVLKHKYKNILFAIDADKEGKYGYDYQIKRLIKPHSNLFKAEV